MGADGVREKDGVKASLNLLFSAGDSVRQALVEDFADQMKSWGSSAPPRAWAGDTAYDRALADPLLWGWGAHTPMELYNITIQKKRAAPPGIPPMEMRRWTHIWIRRWQAGIWRNPMPCGRRPSGTGPPA